MSNPNTYTCSQARIIAEKGESYIMQADIMELGDAVTQRIQGMREELRHQYWSLHERIGKHEFKGYHDQLEALEKLGQLAIAMKSLDDTHSAFNSVRCW